LGIHEALYDYCFSLNYKILKFQSFNHFGDVAPSRPSNDPKNAIKSFGNTNPGMYAVKIPKPQLDTFVVRELALNKYIQATITKIRFRIFRIL
jgi:hypothetical protein